MSVSPTSGVTANAPDYSARQVRQAPPAPPAAPTEVPTTKSASPATKAVDVPNDGKQDGDGDDRPRKKVDQVA